ncbi:MAG: DNA ligase-associated DEXH box helicase, partial [Pseudoxanthomonas sp.]
RHPPRLSLDVLAQHCVSCALGGGFDGDMLFHEIRGTHAFSALDRNTWQAVLDFVVQGGQALASYPDFRKVLRDEHGVYRTEDRRIALRHRLSIGTITSDGSVNVKFLRGGGLGSVEEAFVGRLRRGDRFQFAGRTLELVRLEDMTAYVRIAKSGQGTVPKWMGGRMPLSSELGREVESVFGGDHLQPELRAIAPLLALQARLSSLPASSTLVAEWIGARDGRHLFLYPFAGRQVHEGLASLLSLRWARLAANTFSFAANDYGLVLSPAKEVRVDAEDLRDLLSPDGLLEDLRASLNLSELARRQFREIARVAGLLSPSLPGRMPRSQRQLQASSGLLYDVLLRFDPEHLLLAQAEREVLSAQLEVSRLAATLTDCAQRDITLHVLESLTPLSFPLWAESVRGQLSTEDWKTRVQRAAAKLEKQHGR